MLLAASHWTGYTVFSVISGVLLVLMTVTPGLSPGRRVMTFLGGVAMAVYGIYVANQTTGTYFFSVYIFVVPVVALVMFVKSIMSYAARHPGSPGNRVNQPIARPQTVSQPIANPSHVGPAGVSPVPAPVPRVAPMLHPEVADCSAPPVPLTGSIGPRSGFPQRLRVPPLPDSELPTPTSAAPRPRIVIELSDLGDA